MAELNGDLAGFAKLRRDRPLPTDERECGLELEKIYIAPGHTGGGIGSALLDACVQRARREGASCIWLDVLKTNTGARRLYERHGYVVCGELPFAGDEGEVGLWVMQQTLP